MDEWAAVAAEQGGLVTREQLRKVGVDRWRVRNQLAAGRWVERTSTVIGTTTGDVDRQQLMWLGVLHARSPALVGDLTAAELGGLRGWHRDDVTILLPAGNAVDEEVPGVRWVRTRRPLGELTATTSGVPRCRIQPAVLHFAAHQSSRRTAQGVLAAVVQQRLTTSDSLLEWVDRMRPLRWAPMFRQVLGEIAGGAHSVAELDVGVMCRAAGLRPPDRQTTRKDRSGKNRYLDCEWDLPTGVVALEVDGSFHMDVEHWEDDITRQRRLTRSDRLVVRCTAREVRDVPDEVAADLLALGVPLAA